MIQTGKQYVTFFLCYFYRYASIHYNMPYMYMQSTPSPLLHCNGNSYSNSVILKKHLSFEIPEESSCG